MMSSYTVSHPVTFSEHNFVAKIGDVCVYNSETKKLVFYREDNIIAQIEFSQHGVNSMATKNWIKPVVNEPVAIPVPDVTESEPEEAPDADTDPEVQSEDDKDLGLNMELPESFDEEDGEEEENSEDPETETPTDQVDTPVAKVKKKPGRKPKAR